MQRHSKAAGHNQIYLVGMTHAGKTTAGAILAGMLQWRFVDTDTEIARRKGMSVSSIFERYGEPAFRQLEYDLLSTIDTGQVVIATGGGASVNGDLMELMRKRGYVVFIDVPVRTLAERVQAGADDRPLLRGLAHEELVTKLSAMYHERSEAYSRAHLSITGVSEPVELAAGIFKAFRDDQA